LVSSSLTKAEICLALFEITDTDSYTLCVSFANLLRSLEMIEGLIAMIYNLSSVSFSISSMLSE